MLPLGLLITFILTHLTIISHATLISPTISSSLAPRDTVCSNAPDTKAGNHLNAPTLPPISPRRTSSTPTIWCTPGTRTYISYTPRRPLPFGAVYGTLQAAALWTSRHIAESGDGLLQHGLFNWRGIGGIHVTVWDANNHQVTYGVLGSVVVGLEGMMARDGYGEGAFEVYDGENWVGTGIVALS